MAQRLDFEKFIGDFYGIEALNLFNKGITISDADIPPIVDVLIAHTEIQLLILSGNKITAKGVKVLMKDIQKTNINGLWLTDNPIGDDGVTTIAKALPFLTKLKEIFLHNVNMTDIGAKALLEGIQYNASIRYIDIGNWNDEYQNTEQAVAYQSQISALLRKADREKRSKAARATSIFKWLSQNVDSFAKANDSFV